LRNAFDSHGRRDYGRPLVAREKALNVTKAELGTKRLCPNCGARYYDLNRDPILCPRCGTRFEVAAVTRARPAAKAAVAAEPEEAELEKDPIETVTLEEADEEAAAGGAVKVDDEDDDEIDGDDDDTFLAEEDEDDDVEDIVGDVDDEET
jgi:uncharacterized protein (TIGR02300 family)